MEKASLLVVLVDDPPAVVLQQLPQTRVAVDGCPPIPVNDRSIASSDPVALADGCACINFATVEHNVQRLLRSEPVMGDPHRPVLVQTQRATVAQLLGAAVIPDVILSFNTI